VSERHSRASCGVGHADKATHVPRHLLVEGKKASSADER
jgi:hypothetical protein